MSPGDAVVAGVIALGKPDVWVAGAAAVASEIEATADCSTIPVGNQLVVVLVVAGVASLVSVGDTVEGGAGVKAGEAIVDVGASETTGSVEDSAGVISEGFTVGNVVDAEEVSKVLRGELKMLDAAGSVVAAVDDVATSDASVTAAEVLTAMGVVRLSEMTAEIDEGGAASGTSSEVGTAAEIADSVDAGVTTDVESELGSVSDVGMMLEVEGPAGEVDSGADDDTSVLGSVGITGDTVLEEEITGSGTTLDEMSVEGKGADSDVESEVNGVTELVLSVTGGLGGALDEEV